MEVPYSRTLIGGLPWYSVLVVSGIALAIWLASREERRVGLPRDTVVDLALTVVPLGIVGARMYYVAMSWPQFAGQPISVLYIWQGGLAIYGGVIGGALGAWLYARRKKLDFWTLADIIAPGLLLAQAVGRWGNYFNMEAYGPLITDPALQFFPFGVLIGDEWHMATFFYESMWNLAGFALLWAIRKHQPKRGHVFAWYLVVYGSGRFLIEQLRQDSLYIGGLRASQWLSLLLCAAACAALLKGASKQNRHFALGLGCAVLWLARWAFIGQAAWYGAILLTAGLGAIWLLRNQHSLWLLAGVIAMDAAGLLASMQGGTLMLGLHALLCSMTLPGLMLALCLREN